MLLVSLEVLDDVLLLPEFGVEELGVALKFVGESLVRLVDELGLVADSLQECIVDLRLDVVEVVLLLVLLVVIEGGFDLRVKFLLSLLQVHHDAVVLLLLFAVDGLLFLHFHSQLAQVLDLWSQFLLSNLDLFLNFLDGGSNLLQRLVLLIVEQLFLVRDSLDLFLDMSVPLNSSHSLFFDYELLQVLSS